MSIASKNTLQPTQAWLEHHRFCFKQAIARQKKELARSLITWLVIAIALVLPTALYITLIQLEPMLQSKPEPQLNIYLNAPTEMNITNIVTIVKEQNASLEVDTISPEQALEQLASTHSLDTQLSFNPLPYTIIVSGSPRDLSVLENKLRLETGVSTTQLDREWVQRWNWIVSLGERGLLTLSLILILGAVATIGNTVALTIVARRHEIAVMTLVGATESFVRRPFIYFGIINGVMGGLVCCVMLIALTLALYSPWQQLIHSYNIAASSVPLVTWLFPVFTGLLIGGLGALIACKRYIKTT